MIIQGTIKLIRAINLKNGSRVKNIKTIKTEFYLNEWDRKNIIERWTIGMEELKGTHIQISPHINWLELKEINLDNIKKPK